MIRHIYVFTNGMVAVLDEHGQQMPEYQGKWGEMREKIERDKSPDAKIMYQGSKTRQ